MDACGVLVILIVGAIVLGGGLWLGLYFYNLNQTNKQLQYAFTNYKQALELLKQQPSNPDFHQSALKWGRYYSNLTRDQKGVTVYDEVALANDLKAASAGASTGSSQPVKDSEAASAQP